MSYTQQQPLKRDLQIVAWNANGLAARCDELVEFLARHKPYVLLVSEIFLTLHRRLRLPNYVLHRDDDRSNAGRRPGRGTAIAENSVGHQR